MNTNSNCKKGINWKKLLFTMLCGVVAFSTMFLTACGKKKDPSDPTPPPEVGGDWYTGAELPTANTGSLGDFYFKTDSYQVYKLCDDGWKLIVELSSLLGQEGVSWHYGNDEPSEFVGVPGDYYLDQTDGDIYFSGSNGWEKVYNLMGVSTDQVAVGEVAEVYIGYDGYVWIGDSRTTHRPKTIVGANDIVDNTLELKKGYFTSMQLDTTSHAVALMSGYKVVNEGEANEYATTSYSHTTLTNIQLYADADGLLELAVANVKDVLAKVTAGQEIESTTKAVVEVKEGFNNLTVSVVVGYNETLVLGGTNTTSKLYVVTGVTADDDYGVISSVNEGNKSFNATDGIKDKLVLQAKAGAHTILTGSYIKTETTHGHPCANCSTIFDIENHEYVNGVCTVCNYSHINHSSTVYDNISSSTHSKICDTCGITYSEGNHTYGEYTSIDHAKHYQECTECGYRLEGTHNYLNSTCTDCGYIHVNHSSTNYDNVSNDEHSKECDVCGQIYAVDFHTFSSYTSFDKTKHYRQCSICQYIRYEDHNFLNSTCVDCNYTCTEHNYTNGECTCGATHPCPGNGEFVFVTENTVDDKCIKECSECGLQIELTHNYIDGVCSNCTHSHQAHEYTLGVCDICDFEHQNHSCDTYTKIDNEKHGKICEVCHVSYDVVDHTLSEYKVYNIHQHYRNCTSCDHVVSESHTYEDSTCTICNHTCSSHEYTNGECVCGYDHECDLVNSYTYSSADGDANCLRTCTVCNRQTEVTHDYSNGKCSNCEHFHIAHHTVGEFEPVGDNHIKYCDECGYDYIIEPHTYGEEVGHNAEGHYHTCEACGYECVFEEHDYVDGVCSECNYEHTPHTYGNGECTICGYVCNHSWEFGVCATCGMTHDCEAGNSFSHANATDDLCIKNCTTCGKAYTNAEHGYYLGTCVYCGHSHVNHIEDGWTVDEDSHYKYCAVCTAELESGEHNLGEIDKNSSDIQNHYRYCSICESGVGEEHTYQDGVCTECDYECEHSFGELKDLNGGEHYRECFICKYQEIDNHEFGTGSTCSVCGHTCVHSWDSGYCEFCGIAHDCESEGIYKFSIVDSITHIKNCGICNNYIGEYEHNMIKWEYEDEAHHFGTCVDCKLDDLVAHRYENGKCKDCEHECEHYMEGCECIHCDYENHSWDSGVCSKCNYECEHNMVDCECTICDYSNHNWNFGTCSQCGGSHDCEADGEIYWWNYGDPESGVYCRANCSICLYEWDVDHNFENGTCTQCGYTHENHKYDANHLCTLCKKHDCITVDEYVIVQNTKYNHAKKCTVCNYVYDTLRHTFDENNICTGCSYEHGEHEYYTDITMANEYTHTQQCTICGHSYDEKHTIYYNKCSVCEWEHYSCIWGEWECEDNLEHSSTCAVCGNGNWTWHSYPNNDGKCPTCGYECDHDFEWENGLCSNCKCEHKNHTFGDFENKDSSRHARKCSVCNYEDLASHTFEDGVCTVCNCECVHEYSWKRCTKCGKEHDCVNAGSLGAYVYDNSMCSMYCGICYYEDITGHNYVNGTCTLCEHECTHTNSGDEPSYTLGVCNYCKQEHNPHSMNEFEPLNKNEHHRWCEDECGYEIIANHNYVGGICTICFYECVEHEYENCVCVYCKTTNHNYVNCECTNCGHAIHSFKPVVPEDEEDHKKECANCGLLLLEGHQWSNGVCSVCGYEHENHDWDNEFFCTVCHSHDCINDAYDFIYGIEKTVDEYCLAKCPICEREIKEEHCYSFGACDICNHNHQNHVFVDDWCEICGFHDCSVLDSYYYEYADDDSHLKLCTECDLGSVLSHNFENGVCVNCEHEHENHEYENGVCTVCDYEHDCANNGTVSNGYCVCGKAHTCAETNKFNYTSESDYECIKTCRLCGTSNTIDHAYDSNSKCSNCGNECGHYYASWHNDGLCAYCYAPHEDHTFEDDYCTVCYKHDCPTRGNGVSVNLNDEGHEIECLTCQYVNRGSHTYSNGVCTICDYKHQTHSWDSGVCKLCGIAHDCESEGIYKFNFVDSITHIKNCGICNKYIGEYEHNMIKWEYKDDHHHFGTCVDCKLDDMVAHEFENCVCIKCDFECVDHNYRDGVCTICDYEHQTHSWDSGVCEICGSSHECFNNWHYEENGEEYHKEVCNICGDTLTDDLEHQYENGYCSACKYYHVNHTWENGTCSTCAVSHNCGLYDETLKYMKEDSYTCLRTCTVCNKTEEMEHCYESDSICDNCFGICTHYYDPWDNDGVCAYCYAPHKEHNFFENSSFVEYCTVCHKHDCIASGNADISYNAEWHEVYCYTCGYEHGGEHVYYNGACVICGYEHENHEEAECVCFVCGYATHDTGDDCICDICGQEEHAVDLFNNGDICPDCGEFVHLYKDGMCVYCGEEHTDHEGDYHYVNGNSHALICDICGGVYGDYEPHDDTSNVAVSDHRHAVVCTECGQVCGETEYHDFYYSVEEHDKEYYHHIHCSECDLDIIEPHYVNCTLCGYSEE